MGEQYFQNKVFFSNIADHMNLLPLKYAVNIVNMVIMTGIYICMYIASLLCELSHSVLVWLTGLSDQSDFHEKRKNHVNQMLA